MTLAIRLVLIVAAVISTIFVILNIRQSKMRIEDTVFWMLLVFFILLLSIFPQIGSAFSDLLGFQAPINFIFLFFIFILLAKCFSISTQLSQQETKTRELAQRVALDQYEHYERTKGQREANRQ